MPKVSEEYKQKKRQQILKSAKKCFSEKGYQATSIDDIIEDSKISKGTVYNYFKNKQELYFTLFDQSAEQGLDVLRSEFKQLDDPQAKLSHLFDSYKAANINDENWLNMQRVQGEFWSNASRNEELGQLMTKHSEKYVSFIAKIIDEGKAKSMFRADVDSKVIAEIVLSLADGMITHLLIFHDEYPYEALFELAEDAIMSFLSETP